MTTTAPNVKRILVLGDWVVDDYWVIGRHNSDLSTNTAKEHTRSLHNPANCIREFCGAGLVARFFYNSELRTKSGVNRFDVVGLGVWDSGDTIEFRKLFEGWNTVGDNPYRLIKRNSRILPKPDQVKLVNLGPILASKSASKPDEDPRLTETPRCSLDYDYDKPDEVKQSAVDDVNEFVDRLEKLGSGDSSAYFKYGTTRIFRVYRRKGQDLQGISRTDWELPPHGCPSEYLDWFASTLPKDGPARRDALVEVVNEIRKELGDRPFDAFVIKDHGKGVVSREMLQCIEHAVCNGDAGERIPAKVEKFKAAPWFVSTKMWDAPWLTFFNRDDIDLQLLHFPNIAASHVQSVFTWLNKKEKPTDEALRAIKAKANNLKQKNLIVTVMPTTNGIIAFDSRNRNVYASSDVYQFSEVPDLEVGKSTSFFEAMVLQLLATKEKRESEMSDSEKPLLGKLLAASAGFAKTWVNHLNEKIKESEKYASPRNLAAAYDSENDLISGQYVMSRCFDRIDGELIGVYPKDGRLPAMNFDKLISEWEQSLKGLCLVAGRGAPEFQPWRAELEIHGYPCCQFRKRKKIAKAINLLKNFKPSDNQKPLSGLLIAGPGSGKSFFMERLAKEVECVFLPFNITTMLHREDLLSVFDEIATEQIQNKGRTILVFVDEINAKVDGQHVYDVFLTPLEDGYYMRAGIRHTLRPCVWFFATTSRIAQRGHAAEFRFQGESDTKVSDFKSRMTMPDLHLSGKKKATNTPKKQTFERVIAERIYVGVSVAQRIHPDARRISKYLLRVLARTKPESTNREITRFLRAVTRCERSMVRIKFVELAKPENKGLFSERNWADIAAEVRQPDAHEENELPINIADR